ncbi:hypothetical protein [Sabulibacter ruber]|uniref:hypothetical protein n=1 Tax=Sabulibacter ruber TaxID=2811901 RepID=UPI001A970B30|nr:hypothetical protein [Sabulibacter ruber]
MEIPLPFLLGVAVLLGSWLTWLAVRRPDRRRLAWRLLASWGVVACLVLLLVPPKINRTYNASEVLLLTDGYSPDTLQRLLKSLKPRPQVYGLNVDAEVAQPVADLTAFLKQHPEVKTIHVLGHGLPAEEMPASDSLRFVPHLSELPTGVLAASWPKEVTLGEEVQVQGTFHAPSAQETKVFLHSSGAARDSAAVKKGAQAFRLKFTPKTGGKFVYTLRWTGANDSVYQEAVPVEVKAPRPLSVLVLSSAPSFEVKFLKNFLSQQGHHVAIRTQVSKGIFQTEVVNLASTKLDRLTTGLLQKFDAVLLDETALQNLSGAEKQALQQAVRQQGLGTLTTLSQPSSKAIPFFAETVFKPVSQKQPRNGTVRWQGLASSNAVLSLPTRVLQLKDGQQAMVWEQNQQQTLAVRYRRGMGQVGVSVLPETFPLVLEGKETLYQQYWATVLNAIAKPAEEPSLAVMPSIPQAHQLLQVSFSVNSSAHKVTFQSLKAGTAAPVLVQPSSLLQEQQQGLLWPQETGWYSVLTSGGQESSAFVQPENSWQTQKLQQQQQAFLKLVKQTAASPDTQSMQVQTDFPLWGIGLFLLVSLSYLWLEEKL